MKQKFQTLKSSLVSAGIIFAAGMTCILLVSCDDRPKSLGDKIEDGLNTRPNEKAKDTAEDIGDAVKDAAEETKDAVKDATGN
jgi:hypothetical protein